MRIDLVGGRSASGALAKQATVWTGMYSLCPEPEWKLGREYLVYARARGDTLETGPCWDVHEASDSLTQLALKELGRPDWRRRWPF